VKWGVVSNKVKTYVKVSKSTSGRNGPYEDKHGIEKFKETA